MQYSKYLIILLFVLPKTLFAQDITGLWKGTLYNDTTQQFYKYEIGISKEKGKYSGFSHTWFILDDKQYYGVKKIKIKVADDGKIVVEDDGLIANNYPVAPSKNVRQLNILQLDAADSVMKLTGPFTTNATKDYRPLTGTINLQRKNDFWQSALVPHLQELGKEEDLSFVKEEIETLALEDSRKKIAERQKQNEQAADQKAATLLAKQQAQKDKESALLARQAAEEKLQQEKLIAKAELAKQQAIKEEQEEKERETKLLARQQVEEQEFIEKQKIKEEQAEQLLVKKRQAEKEAAMKELAKKESVAKTQAEKQKARETFAQEQAATAVAIDLENKARAAVKFREDSTRLADKKTADMAKKAESEKYKAAKQLAKQQAEAAEKAVKEKDALAKQDAVKKTQAENNAQVSAQKNALPSVASESEKNKVATTTSNSVAAANVTNRTTVLQQTVSFTSDSLQLSLYDNGEVDGDTVSVLMNGELIIAKQGLSTTAIKKTIYLPSGTDRVELVMYAESLGSIPPNTGLLVIRDGKSLYEIRFRGDLQKNASIVFNRRKE
ncbi:MAG: hypothetical protein H7X88_07300 [Gloeobacteraceae cyanobacterium ES-bin-316]|nr:hypothetical protein [Ferruginibacter sp.]